MTASYPFTREPVTYPGQLPDDEPAWDVRPHRFWLGQPGAMRELPSADSENYTAAQSRGEVEQGLASGAAGMIRLPHTVSRWSIAWQRLTGWERSVLDGFYRGAFGPGPFCFVPPEDVNRLTLAQSMCGGLNGVAEGWTVGSGTLTYDSTQTAPIEPCGVLRWSGAGVNSALTASPRTGGVVTPDPSFNAPYLPAEPVAVSAWMWTATGTASVRLYASGRNADGSTPANVNTVVTLTTTPQLVQVAAMPGVLLTSQYVVVQVNNLTASAPDILLSNAQLEYRDFRTDWALGSGVPRVNFAPDGRSGRSFDVHMNEPSTITLADAIAGRQ